MKLATPGRREAPIKVLIAGLALSFFGAGCVDVRVIGTDKERIPRIGATEYAENATMAFELRKTKNNQVFRVFRLKDGEARLKLQRPSKDDRRTVLCVPGTYTSPKNIPEGFVVLDGKTIQAKERMGWNGAAFFRSNGTIAIFSTNNGHILTRDYLKTVERDGASLIQGHLLVHDGVKESLAPQTPYQRRAVTTMQDGSAAIIESDDLMELREFAEYLIELGVKDAMNLDMGQWSEGWYRDPTNDVLRSIGYLTGETEKQSNWIVFRSR